MSSPGPSISERGGQNSPPRCTTTTNAVKQPQIIQIQQPSTSTTPIISVKPKPIIINGTSAKFSDVKHQQPQFVTLSSTSASPLFKKTITATQKKEVKIYKVPANQANQTTINATNITGAVTSKKVTIQMKDAQGNLKQPTGTFVINKNNGNISGKF